MRALNVATSLTAPPVCIVTTRWPLLDDVRRSGTKSSRIPSNIAPGHARVSSSAREKINLGVNQQFLDWRPSKRKAPDKLLLGLMDQNFGTTCAIALKTAWAP